MRDCHCVRVRFSRAAKFPVGRLELGVSYRRRIAALWFVCLSFLVLHVPLVRVLADVRRGWEWRIEKPTGRATGQSAAFVHPPFGERADRLGSRNCHSLMHRLGCVGAQRSIGMAFQILKRAHFSPTASNLRGSIAE